MACHEATGQMVLFSGQNAAGGAYLSEAWSLQGNVWTQLPGPLPPARGHAQMVYDSARERLVLFGGSVPGPHLDDTWEWNGVGWTNPSPVVRPPGRYDHAMAYDVVRGVTVLFGGRGNAVNYLQDLWEWDGTVWQQRFPATSPSARSEAMMAFDAELGVVVLHGGITVIGSSSFVLNDTWSWNGTSWQQLLPSTPPTMRFGGRAAGDLDRQRVVIHGGDLTDSFAWEWDGSAWKILLQASPSPRRGHVMAYDATLRRVVLHGGQFQGSTYLNDTWIYQTPQPADVTPFGAGCAGSVGTPSLANAPFTLPWLGDTMTTRVDALPVGGPGAVFVSSFGGTPPIDLAFLGMPGCELLVPLDIIEFAPAAGSIAEWSYAAPMSMSLAGVSWSQQAFPLDAAANAFGLSASNAIEATFGVR